MKHAIEAADKLAVGHGVECAGELDVEHGLEYADEPAGELAMACCLNSNLSYVLMN